MYINDIKIVVSDGYAYPTPIDNSDFKFRHNKFELNSDVWHFEVINMFHKIRVLLPDSDKTTVFDCELYYINGKHQEDLVLIKLSLKSLFSIIQTDCLKGNGVFEGNFVFTFEENTYSLLNVDDKDSDISKQYDNHLINKQEIVSERNIKNALGINDLIVGHTYTKVSKGKIDNVHYLYLGKRPVKDTNDTVIIKHIYANRYHLSFYFPESLVYYSEYNRHQEIEDIFKFEENIPIRSLENLSRWSIIPNTSNKFNEDISYREPLDLSLFINRYKPLIEYNDLRSLTTSKDSLTLINTVGKGKLVSYSIALKVILNKYDNNLYNKEQILYPLKNFKDFIKSNEYVKTISKDIEQTTNIIENYIKDFHHNEEIRIQAIKEYSTHCKTGKKLNTDKELIEYAFNQNRYIRKYESLNDFNFSILNLKKVINNNKSILSELKKHMV